MISMLSTSMSADINYVHLTHVTIAKTTPAYYQTHTYHPSLICKHL